MSRLLHSRIDLADLFSNWRFLIALLNEYFSAKCLYLVNIKAVTVEVFGFSFGFWWERIRNASPLIWWASWGQLLCAKVHCGISDRGESPSVVMVPFRLLIMCHGFRFVSKTALQQVASYSSVNKMTTTNLAIVFGPNLMWSKSQASLTSLGYVNACAEYLITAYNELFVK